MFLMLEQVAEMVELGFVLEQVGLVDQRVVC